MPRFSIATLNHSPLHDLETSLELHLDAAKNAGFEALAPDIFWLRALEKEGTSLESLAEALESAGLGCSEIAGLAIGREDATRTELKELKRYAEVLQADFVNARVTVRADDAARQLLRKCADALAEWGTRIALEFSTGTGLRNLAHARSFLGDEDASGHAVIPITLDTWHFFQAEGGPDWEALEALPVEVIANVQLSDGVPLGKKAYGAETMNQRRLPGEGQFDLARFRQSLRRKGFDGCVIIEVLNARLRNLPIPDFTTRAGATARTWWGR